MTLIQKRVSEPELTATAFATAMDAATDTADRRAHDITAMNGMAGR
ncbi:hypothetical protein [Streptomyces fagopyri]